MMCYESIQNEFPDTINKCRSNLLKHIFFLLILLNILFSFHATLKAQPTTLSKSRTSGYYTYVLRLSNEEMITYYKLKEKEEFESVEFNSFIKQLQLIDSFYTDTAKVSILPYGNYLLLNANRDRIETKLFKNHSFNYSIISGNLKFTCIIYDSIGKPRSDLKVKLNEEVLAYNPMTGYYSATKTHKKGTLSIASLNEIEIAPILNTDYHRSNSFIWRKIKYSFPVYHFLKLYHLIKLRTRYATELDDNFIEYSKYSRKKNKVGYMVCNKPKYFPNDTLKFKAYILDSKHRPIKEDVLLEITKNYYSKPIISRTLRQVTPGKFTGEIILSDSLKLDQDYTLAIKSIKNKEYSLVSCVFRYEDYLLDEIFYHTRLEHESIDSNQSQIIYLKATDINDFNSPDIKYEVTVKQNYISNYYKDSIFVKDTLFNSRGYLNLNNETSIIIPDSLFQSINANYKIDVTYMNSNYEKHRDDLSFSVNRKPLDFYLRQEGKILHISKNNHDKEIPEKFYLIGLDKRNDTLINHKITLPASININPAVESYVLNIPEISISKEISVKDLALEINSLRLKDSVFFKLYNPENILVNYRIYKENELLVDKKDSAFFFQCKDETHASYFVVVDYMWAGTMNQLQSAAILFEKDLNFKINSPNQVYPGKKVKIKINATDFYGKPVKKVDLTAWSISEQFKDIEDPRIPYLGKGKKVRRQNEYEIDHVFKYSGFNRVNFKIGTFWVKHMHLDTIPFYKARSGNEAVWSNYDTITKYIAEFAPFIFDNVYQVPIHMIYIDNNLVYYAYASQGLPYAFSAAPGYHKIKLRTSNKIVEIDSVLFQAGFKLEMVIDYNIGHKNIHSYSADIYLTETERKELRSKIFFLNKNFSDEYFVWQKDQAVHHFSKGVNEIVAIGPFNELSKLKFYNTNNIKKEFLFESGYDYTLSKENIIMKENKRLLANQIPFPNVSKTPLSGEHCLEESDFMFPLLPTNKAKLDLALSDKYPEKPGLGRVKWTIDLDSIISFLMLENLETKKLEFYKSEYYNLYNLNPGAYKMYLITSNFYGQCKSFTIKPNTTTCIMFKDEKYTYFNQVKNEYDCQLDEQEFQKEKLKNGQAIKQNGNSYFDVSYFVNSTKGDAQIKVVVYDRTTNETVPFATVIILKNEQQIAAAAANIDGEALFKGLQSGNNYNVKISYVGYSSVEITNLKVYSGKTQYVNAYLETGLQLQSFEMVAYKVPLIDANTSLLKTVTRTEYSKMATKNINSVVAQTAGVLSKSAIQGYFNGDDSESSENFIDGMRVTGSSGLRQSALQPLKLTPNSKNNDEDSITNEDIAAKSIRNNFSDYAFWQPDLVTDVNGEASFDVTFPDNITKWKTFVVGMNSKKYSGGTSATTKAFKKVMAQLETPRFFIEGDESQIIGKMFNITSSQYPVKLSFTINNKLEQQFDTLLNKSLLTKQQIVAVNDTMHLQFEASLDNGFKDGELKKIPVFKKGLLEKKGLFISMKKDSIYNLPTNANFNEKTISIISNPIHFALTDLKALQNYSYNCNEQMASKLKAYLLEEELLTLSGEKFRNKKQIENLIHKLEASQNDDGSWAWWNGGNAVQWISLHVYSALSKAKEKKYAVYTLDKALAYLVRTREQLPRFEYLKTFSELASSKQDLDFNEWQKYLPKDTARINKNKLYEFLMLQKVLQANKQKANTDSIISIAKSTYTGDIYWTTNDNNDWRQDHILLTNLAYQILKADSFNEDTLSKIRSFLLQQRNYEGGWKNTYQTAKVLSTILPDLGSLKAATQPSQVLISENGNETIVTEFPYIKKMKADKVTIKSLALAPVFATWYETQWNVSPIIKSNDFIVKTHFEKDKVTLSTIKAGETIDLVTEIEVKKKAEYVKLEIPIPAGCAYSNQNQSTSYYEVHREEFKNKTVIFYNQLNPGKYEVRVKLDARYSGEYTLNPAQIELMYLPVFNGNNQVQTINIR